eukprot:5429392-Prymnesium_polylepis.1
MLVRLDRLVRLVVAHLGDEVIEGRRRRLGRLPAHPVEVVPLQARPHLRLALVELDGEKVDRLVFDEEIIILHKDRDLLPNRWQHHRDPKLGVPRGGIGLDPACARVVARKVYFHIRIEVAALLLWAENRRVQVGESRRAHDADAQEDKPPLEFRRAQQCDVRPRFDRAVGVRLTLERFLPVVVLHWLIAGAKQRDRDLEETLRTAVRVILKPATFARLVRRREHEPLVVQLVILTGVRASPVTGRTRRTPPGRARPPPASRHRHSATAHYIRHLKLDHARGESLLVDVLTDNEDILVPHWVGLLVFHGRLSRLVERGDVDLRVARAACVAPHEPTRLDH